MCLCAYLGKGDLIEVTGYLKSLKKSQIYNLGLVLGLDYYHVDDLKENCRHNHIFLDDVVMDWMQGKGQKDVSWTALIDALQHQRLRQNGIVQRIIHERGELKSMKLFLSHNNGHTLSPYHFIANLTAG